METNSKKSFHPTNIFLVCMVVFWIANTGCIRRRLTVRTNPPGAMVYVDKNPIGLSPVSSNFTYYGTRNIEIFRDGYRTERFMRRFSPPWYAIPPLDFFTETLWPFEKRDERIIDVQLTPDPVVPKEALIASAEQLRLQASQGIGVDSPPTISTPAPILSTPSVPIGPSGVPPTNIYPMQPNTNVPIGPYISPQ